MHQNFSTKPLLCNELIGHEHELHKLDKALLRAVEGIPQLVMLSGKAGQGKTKLCRTFTESSQIYDSLVLVGQANPQNQALPFGPFLEAFYNHFMATKGTLPIINSPLYAALAFLLRLLPELTPMFPEVTPALLNTEGTPAQRKQALFHSILSGLQSLAGTCQGPLLLILEDLHYADETSLELLAFLAHRLNMSASKVTAKVFDNKTSLLILCTYRTESIPDSPALDHFLTQLRIQRQVYELKVIPLVLAEHHRFVSSVLGQPVPEAFASFLFAWDEGNPFFTEELLSAMASAGQLQLNQNVWQIPSGMRPILPPSLTSAIIQRFVRLPASDQEVLSYAIIESEFDFTLLSALSGMDERELVAVLRRAMNAQLIGEVSSTRPPVVLATGEKERYQFRHTLIREALYDQMLAPERRMRHRAVAELLEKLMAGNSITQDAVTPTNQLDNVARFLAEHFWKAGLAERARPYALHEAERASQVYAFHEERYYLDMAQASFSESSPERLDLLQRLGVVSLGIYDLSGALQWLTLAKVGYQRSNQPLQILRMLAMMLYPSWLLATSSIPALLAEVEIAAESAFTNDDEDNPRVGYLTIYSQLAIWWAINGMFDRASMWIERAMKLFEVLSDPQKTIAIQFSLAAQSWIKTHGDMMTAEIGLSAMRDVLNFARRHSLPDLIMLCYSGLTLPLIYIGRSDEASQILEELSEYGQLSNIPQYVFPLGWHHFFSSDQWDQVIEQLYWDIERTKQANIPSYTAQDQTVLAHFLIARNQLVEAQSLLTAAMPKIELANEYFYLTQLWWGLAKLLTAQGHVRQAEQYYERLLQRWEATGDTYTILSILPDGIELYTDTHNLLKAQQWLDILTMLVHRTGNPVGSAALMEAQGIVDAAKGGAEEAVQSLRESIEMLSKLKRPYRQALASHSLVLQ